MMKFNKMILSILTAISLIGCGGSGSSSNNNSTGNDNIRFNIRTAATLQASSAVIDASSSISANKLFSHKTFKTSTETVTEDGSVSLAKIGTNLIGVTQEGSASLAISSNAPIKVMYSAVNPVNNLVYIVLDPDVSRDLFNADGTNLQRSIAENNCAFYEVNPEDDSFRCVSEGKILQDYNQTYLQAISGNQKPVQFDEAGNVYFSAREFTEEREEFISFTSSSFNLYKYDISSSALTVSNVTPDSDNILFFVALSGGELVYEGISGSRRTLFIRDASGTVTELAVSGWGVDFFTADDQNTVLFGATNGDGIRIVQPGASGIVNRTTLSTSLFAEDERVTNSNGDIFIRNPLRIIIANDSKIYGVFHGSRIVYDATGTNLSGTNTLDFFQILPFSPALRAEVDISELPRQWWTVIFQISQGSLYYIAKDRPTDYIKILNLSTNKAMTLLEPTAATDTGYNLYQWRLAGDTLYFSGLDNNTNALIVGEIDTIKVKQGATKEQFLTIRNTTSALGSIAEIQDIAVIPAQATETDTSNITPTVATNGIRFNSDSPYSISVEFSKNMNKSTVIPNLAIVSSDNSEGNAGVIPYLPIWIDKTLHLLPDLSTDTFADLISVGLSNNVSYTLDFRDGIMDKDNLALSDTEFDQTVVMMPDIGWYVGESSSNNASISIGNVIKFAGLSSSGVLENYLLQDMTANNFRLEFSEKNFGLVVGHLILWDDATNPSPATSLDYNRILSIRMNDSGTSYYGYQNSSSYDTTVGRTIQEFASGSWQVYRLDVYASTFTFSVSVDGINFVEVISANNLRDRPSGYKLIYKVSNKLSIDNIKISTLTAAGALTTSTGDLLDTTTDDFPILPTIYPKLDAQENGNGLDAWDRY